MNRDGENSVTVYDAAKTRNGISITYSTVASGMILDSSVSFWTCRLNGNDHQLYASTIKGSQLQLETVQLSAVSAPQYRYSNQNNN